MTTRIRRCSNCRTAGHDIRQCPKLQAFSEVHDEEPKQKNQSVANWCRSCGGLIGSAGAFGQTVGADPRRCECDVSRDSYMTFIRGWTDGAGVRAIRDEFANHPELGPIYHEGYAAGRVARGEARVVAEKRFGYQEKILRITEDAETILE